MINQHLIEVSDFLFEHGPSDSAFHPIDRHFLNPFIDTILTFDKIDFICHNLERGYNTYTSNLLLSLPELWENMSYEEVLKITNSIKAEYSYYCLIAFTMTFIEINSLSIVLTNNLSSRLRAQVITYVKRNYPSFIKDETDYLFLGKGGIGVTNDQWMQIKATLLKDPRFEEAPQNLYSLETYLNGL